MVSLVYPMCRLDRVQEFRRRVKQGMAGGLLVTRCRCGLVVVECQDAPRMVTVCHCSVCRYDEALPLQTDNAAAPSFAAVMRNKCVVRVRGSAAVEWRQSSEFARRGRCGECQTSLVMDYEWFEPNTVWLVRPTWKQVD